jgi:hypothetical protein
MRLSELWYRHPVTSVTLSSSAASVGTREGRASAASGSLAEKASTVEGNAARIPAALRLDEILDGHTCSPASIRDFNKYLEYVEFSSENLAFVIW